MSPVRSPACSPNTSRAALSSRTSSTTLHERTMPRLPHNNRVSTSHALKTSDIWSKTIGHDPYASQTGGDDGISGDYGSNAEKARGLLELARHQNLTGGRSGGGDAGGDDFARKMFLGLKGGKKRSGGVGGVGNVDAIHARALLEEESSSSEDEFIHTAPPTAGEGKPKAVDGGLGRDSSSIDSSSSSSSDERERKRRRRHKEKKRSKSSDNRRKKKSSKHRKHSSSRKMDQLSSSSEDESSGDDNRHHKRRRHHHKHKHRDKQREGGREDRKRKR